MMCSKQNYLYFLSILIACLASSCVPDTPGSEDADRGAELSFAASDLTRASVTTSLDQFAVYGDMKLPGSNNATPFVMFNKTKVEYKNDNWFYDGTQYWFPKHEHSFVAVSPLSVLDTDNNPQYSNSRLSFTYTIPTTDGNLSDKNAVPDILAATHRRLYIPEDDIVNNTVAFRFGHMMSLINIAPALNDNIMDKEEYIEFRKLELTGFKTKATFKILPASRLSYNQTDDWDMAVTDQEGEANLTIEFAEPKKVINNGENVKLFDENDAIIMLPQVFSSDSQAKIILTYTINNETETRQISSPLKLLEWEPGKGYTYRFTLDRTGLLFGTTTITDWEVMNAANIDAH